MFRMMFCTTVLSLLAATSLQAAPITVPTSLNLGDQYRLAFVTSGGRDATSSDIDDYNDFVQTAADAVTELAALGATWKAIGSTETVDARDNTDTNPASTGVPIFLLNDTLLASDNADLWDGSIQTFLQFDESGTLLSNSSVFTGTTGIGTGGGRYTLAGSSGTSGVGTTYFANSIWIEEWFEPSIYTLPFYAMSDVLTVVPEPSGDLNEDGFIDAADAGIMFGNWGPTTLGYFDGNLNGDGFIDAADAGIMFANWTGDVGPVGIAVPEPAALVLVGIAGAGLAGWRNRTANRDPS